MTTKSPHTEKKFMSLMKFQCLTATKFNEIFASWKWRQVFKVQLFAYWRNLHLQGAYTIQQPSVSNHVRTLMMETKSVAKTSAWVYLDNLTLLAAWDAFKSVPVAAPSKLRVYGLSFAGIAGSNPAGVRISACCGCCVLSGRGLCVGLITRPEESYRMCACVWVWSWNLDNEETLAHWRLSRYWKKMYSMRQELWSVVETQVSWDLVKATSRYRQIYTYGSHKVHENSSRSYSLSVKDYSKDCCFSSPGRGGKFSPLWFRSNLHRARRWMGHEILSLCLVGIHLTVTSSTSNWEILRLRKEGRRNLIASNC
jgi:hypothetical protein